MAVVKGEECKTCPMRDLSRVELALLLIVASILLLLTQPTAAEAEVASFR